MPEREGMDPEEELAGEEQTEPSKEKKPRYIVDERTGLVTRVEENESLTDAAEEIQEGQK